MADEHKYSTIHKNGNTIIKDETLKEEKLQHKEQRNQKIKSRISSYASNPSGLLGSIILILIGVALIRILYNGSGTIPSFQSLLNLFQDSPPVSASVKNFLQQLQIGGNWGFIDGLRIFFNSVTEFISIIIWMASSLIDVVIFITHFLSWIFI